MSPPDAFFSQETSRSRRGGVVVDRPSVVQSIGQTLNGAFGDADRLPDDLAALLRRLDALDQSPGR